MSKKENKEPSLGRLGGFLGHPITAVIRSCAKAGWEYWEIRAMFDAEKVPVADNTIRIQLSAGRAGEGSTPVSAKELEKYRPDADKKPERSNKKADKKAPAAKKPAKKAAKNEDDEDEDGDFEEGQ